MEKMTLLVKKIWNNPTRINPMYKNLLNGLFIIDTFGGLVLKRSRH